MGDAIDAVDWSAIPGHPEWYEPARAALGLRALADATNLVQAAAAGSLLGGGGILHGHSAAVFPAAAVAAPLLLDIAQKGHPAARDVALGLIDEALSSYPHDEYRRVTTSYSTAVPICCAIAQQVRPRSALLISMGRRGKTLIDSAAEHWLFEIAECAADSQDTAAFGTLAGRLPSGKHAAELHAGGTVSLLEEVVLEYPPVDGSADACLRLRGRHPAELPPGAVLLPAECGDRVH
ncbi:hypothetical protein ACIQ9R_05650 [Streptomyces sp. NPDC094447]|uniref:hypothetical protein n=1 Tax=Streptomyces sp. NPDC094447 TaxID=3366062 RepID=UPI003809FFAC